MIGEVISLLTGAGTGVLGNAISKGFEFFESKQKFAQELQLRKLDIEMMKTEATVAEKQQAMEVEKAAFDASYMAETKRFSQHGDHPSLVWIDFIRGATRPVLTFLFVALTGIIFFVVDDTSLQATIVNTILYMASLTVAWWFGSRPQKRNK